MKCLECHAPIKNKIYDSSKIEEYKKLVKKYELALRIEKNRWQKLHDSTEKDRKIILNNTINEGIHSIEKTLDIRK